MHACTCGVALLALAMQHLAFRLETMCLLVNFRFGLAYGEGPSPNQFCGDALFALNRYSTSFTGTGTGYWTDFFYQWAFSATAVTIPAGSVAERFNFNAYLGKTHEACLSLLYRWYSNT